MHVTNSRTWWTQSYYCHNKLVDDYCGGIITVSNVTQPLFETFHTNHILHSPMFSQYEYWRNKKGLPFIINKILKYIWTVYLVGWTMNVLCEEHSYCPPPPKIHHVMFVWCANYYSTWAAWTLSTQGGAEWYTKMHYRNK